ncbi:MAG: phosphodiester glycosidase family protein [Planctomycetota bacterium]
MPSVSGRVLSLTFEETISAWVVVLPRGTDGWMLSDQGDRSIESWLAFEDLISPQTAVAVNGGYFTSDGLPDGLWLVDGVTRQAVSGKSVLSGLVVIDESGRMSLRPRGASLDDAAVAFQAGPWILDPGGSFGIRGPDGPLAKRTILAQTESSGTLVIRLSEATLYDAARLVEAMGREMPELRAERALNMDGGPSSGLFIDLENPRVVLPPRGLIHHVLFLEPTVTANQPD